MDINWNDIFNLSVSPIEPILRGTIMYFALFLLFRVVIRRRVGAIGMNDLLLVVIIADAAESGLSGDDHTITHGLIVVGTIFFWNWLIDRLNYSVPALRSLLEPSPLPLIESGRILRQNLRHEYVTIEELKSKLREQGVVEPSEVEKAVMEPDGEISVIKRKRPSR